ncbi:DUF4097 domain-containing protein [Dactylosporangium matsuzakiense]|uniref:DUF4097 domain-containing protein n=1 Tax=Dactylosporangium matsuzakiense TaxID=53360 RepID=A0A9W6KEK5_9ACTN|nr:DUF4097 domain-containing protein [Dactylosporangium matsuzakiense]UWZ42455.1 DUF4097 family beta strand repeat protein [Dactylosporangium matsuzakiense]GLL00632.1 hypothetical protein GCM10017581_023730 [Dactylosporangium matsuzakiense]
MHKNRYQRGLAGFSIGLVALANSCGDVGATNRRSLDDVEKVAVTAIKLDVSSGNVTVRSGKAGEVSIHRTLKYGKTEPSTAKTYDVDGGVLTLHSGCGTNCEVSYDIEAPPGAAVTGQGGSGDVSLTEVGKVDVSIGSGNITVTRASGTVHAVTTSGDIKVEDVKSALDLKAGSGNVSGSKLGGGAIVAQSGSGDIRLTLATAGSVKANAGSGDIELRVPDGKYKVITHSNPDDTKVDVTNDPNAKAVLEVTANGGDVHIGH